jgi:hypothetical protein
MHIILLFLDIVKAPGFSATFENILKQRQASQKSRTKSKFQDSSQSMQ